MQRIGSLSQKGTFLLTCARKKFQHLMENITAQGGMDVYCKCLFVFSSPSNVSLGDLSHSDAYK